ncbi:MAG TPA: S53 family peptidase, partial [Gemmataceae bacterium]|nr:S53 family peptidase [Gemmataceae bacterium]
MIALSRRTVSRNRIRPSLRTQSLSSLEVEALESRTLLSATDLASLAAFPAGHFASANFSGTQSPSGYWPAQIRHAYGFDSLSYTGSGQTIAIVDAYDDPNIVSDLARFDAQYGIASANLTKATPQGQPAADAGWSSEIALDVEWAHAVAPGANLLLVEAKDSSLGNLLGAVDYAVGQGAQVVSMSWGAGEFSTETSYDYHFANHPGVTFVASVGDSGASPEWPASSPHVVAVGGTSLNLSSSDTWNSETGWGYGYWSRYYGGSGGGISRYEPKPSYQSSVSQSPLHRTIPDVSYVADPNTGLAVYDSYGSGGWAVYGGTSVGAPQWAGLVALVDQGHGSALTGDAQTLPAI